ncbi:MAG TPA: UTP--glucose-1-phosphate uridylyltransferase [Mycobacteriales bacterium]|nr:UTP--glucose-1-phosphate uridylyltransferase [Mycobacteriales bacterium]
MTLLSEFDEDTRTTLVTYGFDEAEFCALQSRVCDGSLSPSSNVVHGRVEPPQPQDITPLPMPGEPGYDDAREAGLAVLRAGAAAAVVLNGGMATRFGGVVKGVVEAVDGRSFLELKLAQNAELGDAVGARIATAVMNSFATDAATRRFLAERGVPEPLYFSQYVSLRLGPDCTIFRTRDGKPSLYSPGHGDFLPAFRRSGVLDRLHSAGVRYVMVSNVDNLPARLDPVVLGTHVRAGRPMTAEVVRNTGNVGGAPARVDGRPVILESMRFPRGFDHSRLPVTNVNTVTFDIDALDRDFDLTWLYVEKTVEERTAVQIEHLYHEASATLPTTYLQVPATGPRGRFLPVKRPADLDAAQPVLRELLASSPLQ